MFVKTPSGEHPVAYAVCYPEIWLKIKNSIKSKQIDWISGSDRSDSTLFRLFIIC